MGQASGTEAGAGVTGDGCPWSRAASRPCQDGTRGPADREVSLFTITGTTAVAHFAKVHYQHDCSILGPSLNNPGETQKRKVGC